MGPILIVMHASTISTVHLSGAPVRLGREFDNEVVVGDPQASRRHAAILFDEGIAFIADRGSLNGLYVNGKKVASARLRHGDRIQIGLTEIRYHDPGYNLLLGKNRVAKLKSLFKAHSVTL